MIEPSIVVWYESKDETTEHRTKIGYRLCEWAFPVIFAYPVKLFLGDLHYSTDIKFKTESLASVTALVKSPVKL